MPVTVRPLVWPALLLLLGSPLAAQEGTRQEGHGAWALREEFDPDVIPGFASWFQRSIDRVMEDAVEAGVTPGAWVVVGHGGGVVYSRGYGRVDRVEGSPPVTGETLWDLASVTKALATTLAVMVLVEDGRVDLDAPLHRYLDEWPAEGDHGRITLREALSHTAGFPEGLAVRRVGDTRAEWLRALAATPLGSAPGERELYSDLGPLLAGWVVEAVSGEPLDRFVETRIYRHLGLARTLFRPLDAGVPAAEIAPTEKLAQGQLRGVVHDPVARALGGVSGNAGLFSSADDLAVLASALLWEKPARVVCRDVIRDFTRRTGDDVHFGTGWEMPARDVVWSESLSPSAFGHTGYTGTSVWIDPEQDLFVILLTSRLNPTSANEGHVLLRRELHDVVGRAHTDDEAEAIRADWRIPETWRGVDSCRAEKGMKALALVQPSLVRALAW